MYTMKFFILLFLVLSLGSCTGDQQPATITSPVNMSASVSDNKSSSTESKSSDAPPVKKVEDVTSAVHDKIKSKSLDKEQKEIKESQFKQSKNREKSCSDLIIDYEKLIDKIASDKSNLENLEKLKSWANDIFHNTCLKDNLDYQKKYAEINKKLG